MGFVMAYETPENAKLFKKSEIFFHGWVFGILSSCVSRPTCHVFLPPALRDIPDVGA